MVDINLVISLLSAVYIEVFEKLVSADKMVEGGGGAKEVEREESLV